MPFMSVSYPQGSKVSTGWREIFRRYLAVADEILGVERPDVMAQCVFGLYEHVSDVDTAGDEPSHARNVWHTV
jgi:hypothetical protein